MRKFYVIDGVFHQLFTTKIGFILNKEANYGTGNPLRRSMSLDGNLNLLINRERLLNNRRNDNANDATVSNENNGNDNNETENTLNRDEPNNAGDENIDSTLETQERGGTSEGVQ